MLPPSWLEAQTLSPLGLSVPAKWYDQLGILPHVRQILFQAGAYAATRRRVSCYLGPQSATEYRFSEKERAGQVNIKPFIHDTNALLLNDIDVGLVKFDLLVIRTRKFLFTSLKAERATSRCRFHSAPSVPTLLWAYILIDSYYKIESKPHSDGYNIALSQFQCLS